MFDTAEFVSHNPVLMGLQFTCGILFFYGIHKESLKICLFPIVALTLIMLMSSFFLHMYCKFTGTDIDTIESYDHAVMAAVLFWCLVAASVLWYLEKIDKKIEASEIGTSNTYGFASRELTQLLLNNRELLSEEIRTALADGYDFDFQITAKIIEKPQGENLSVA